MRDFFVSILPYLLTALLGLFAIYGYASWKYIGHVSTSSFAEYWKRASPPGQGVKDDFFAIALFPFWCLWVFILGIPPGPEEPVIPEVQALDIDALAAVLRTDLAVILPDKSPVVFDAFVEFYREQLSIEYPTPNLKIPQQIDEWNQKLDNLIPLLRQLSPHFAYFIKHLPLAGDGHSELKSNLASLTTDKDLSNFFFGLSLNELFPRTYGRFAHSKEWARAFTKDNARVGWDKEHEKDSPEYVRFMLKEFPALYNLEVPVEIPHNKRTSGMWIVAPPDSGKTTLLSAILKADLKEVKAGKASVIILDSKGDLVEHVRKLKMFAPGGDLYGKLVLIEPTPELAINPLDLGATEAHSLELLEYIFSSILETKMTPLQSGLFSYVFSAMVAIPGANLATLRDMLKFGIKPEYEKHLRTMNNDGDQDEADFFFKKNPGEKTTEYDSQTYRETRVELLRRIRKLTKAVPVMKHMFKATKTRLNMGQLMDSGNVVVIDNNIGKMSKKGSEFFGRFFVALIQAAAHQRAGRPPEQKKPVYVLMDEASTVIANDPTVSEIINLCRSHNIAMTFAHQNLAQIKDLDVRAALADCAIKIAHPGRDAAVLADDFETDVPFFKNLPEHHFGLIVSPKMKKPVVIEVPDSPVWKWPKMRDDQLEAIRADMRREYGHPPGMQLVVANDDRLDDDDDDLNDTAPGKWG